MTQIARGLLLDDYMKTLRRERDRLKGKQQYKPISLQAYQQTSDAMHQTLQQQMDAIEPRFLQPNGVF